MVFNISQSENEKIKGFYDKAMQELSEFYQMIWNENTPIVFLVENRENINKLEGFDTEDWIIGFTLGTRRLLFILNPDNYEAESSHKYSDEQYYILMKHELSHLYSQILYRGHKPVWLVEGIAIYSSGQLKSDPKPEKFRVFLKYMTDGGKGLHYEAGFAVEIMIKDKGKKHFLEFYKAQKDVKTIPDLEKLFKEYYGEELNYDYFNKRL